MPTSTADRPFALPADSVEIVVDLPFPPSTNRIWRVRGHRVYRSKEYIEWCEAADMQIMASKQYPKRKINGPFEVHFAFKPGRAGMDLDNRLKAVLDYLQSRSIVADDKHCRRLTAEWREQEMECRVTLRSLHDGVAQ